MKTDAAGEGGADRAAWLDRLFSSLIEMLKPDYGQVELPGHPQAVKIRLGHREHSRTAASRRA